MGSPNYFKVLTVLTEIVFLRQSDVSFVLSSFILHKLWFSVQGFLLSSQKLGIAFC